MACDACVQKFNELRGHIPSLSMVLAIVILIVNIIVPGIGTICFICLGGSGQWVEHLVIGLLQFFLTFFLIGWIWSICWGVFAVMKAS